jgi:hypothetical protein
VDRCEYAEIEALGVEARAAQANAEPFKVFTPPEARTMAAFAAQIIPTDNTPGATEAGAVYFIDRALAGWAAPLLSRFRQGSRHLMTRQKRKTRHRSFADVSPAQQVRIMMRSERTGILRFRTLVHDFRHALRSVHTAAAAMTRWH